MLEVLFHPLRFYWDYANTHHGRGDGGGWGGLYANRARQSGVTG